jgi:hypothetical protein
MTVADFLTELRKADEISGMFPVDNYARPICFAMPLPILLVHLTMIELGLSARTADRFYCPLNNSISAMCGELDIVIQHNPGPKYAGFQMAQVTLPVMIGDDVKAIC